MRKLTVLSAFLHYQYSNTRPKNDNFFEQFSSGEIQTTETLLEEINR